MFKKFFNYPTRREAWQARKNFGAVFIAMLCIFAMANSSFAAAAVDAGVQEAIDSFELTFGGVKTVVLTILVFAVGYKLARKWLKG